MQLRSKLVLGGLAGLLAVGGVLVAPSDPEKPIDDLVAVEPKDPGPTPLVVFFCCGDDGCEPLPDDSNFCLGSDVLVYCGCPASEPDGTVSCNC